tara:strand:- start:3527 stop:4147 length:621 start_codon:yes stop_codon:yes gene_type:complete
MKYIFVAGAPGSKWSSVVKNIYYSPSIDRSDYADARTYYHDASGKRELMHLGAYFDPGMEFGHFFDKLNQYSKEECEAEFNRPFSGEGIRIIKSHVFANHIDYIRATWPDCPIVLVHRDDDACLGWWVKCGHFDITYPRYHDYYKDLRTMAGIIRDQNDGIQQGAWQYPRRQPQTNQELARILDIAQPPEEYSQAYAQNNIRVRVI